MMALSGLSRFPANKDEYRRASAGELLRACAVTRHPSEPSGDMVPIITDGRKQMVSADAIMQHSIQWHQYVVLGISTG
jgi:hypothetical protein